MLSAQSGEMLYRGVGRFTVSQGRRGITVERPGYYPRDGSEGIHVGDDMAITEAALRTLKEEIEAI